MVRNNKIYGRSLISLENKNLSQLETETTLMTWSFWSSYVALLTKQDAIKAQVVEEDDEQSR